MRTLVTDNLNFKFRFSPSISLFDFPSFSREIRYSHQFSRRKWICIPRNLNFSSFKVCCASNTTSYGGWEDMRRGGDSDQSGESNQLRNFLISLGIDDRKYVFVFFLGVVCALAIARVRVSTIVAFPASVIVFAVGFSFGFIRRGSANEISVSSSRKKSFKEENFKVSFKKLRNSLEFFNEFDVKLNNLKNHVKNAVDNDHITVNDLENYVKVMDSMSLATSHAKKRVEGCIDSIGILDDVGNSNGELVENQKSSRGRKEVGETGFDLSQFFGGMFGENLVGLKSGKMKDSIKRGAVEMDANNQTEENILAYSVEELLNPVDDDKGNAKSYFSQNKSNKPFLNQGKVDKLGGAARNIKSIPENGKMGSMGMDRSTKRLLESEEYSYQNCRLRFTNNHHVSFNMGHHHATQTWESYDSLLDSVNFGPSLKRMEAEASFEEEQMLRKSHDDYIPFQSGENNEAYSSNIREEIEERGYPEDGPRMANTQTNEGEVGYSSSSLVSDDMLFDRYLAESNGLLKQARASLRSGGDEDRAEVVLYKSAEILSKAMAMKPMSLLTVGQLGNTYLLHGELKLKISRELRTLLSRNDPLSSDKWGRVLKGLDDHVASKDRIASLLVNVCEECEELLVEAGRKYRMALSIDANDIRALYNWGLALSFRAQLIADIGPEAAFDADKVFLAAIDKFDAMMSKGNLYTHDALFRWGVALQHRSRLRPRKSKEKVKLLQQAKRLYEDALDIDSDNFQVRQALSSCISELNFRNSNF